MKRVSQIMLGLLILGFSTGMGAYAEGSGELTAKDYGEGAKDAAVVIGAGVVGGGVAGAAIAAGVVINNRLDQANEAADKYNEQMDRKLKEQKAELCKQSGRYCE